MQTSIPSDVWESVIAIVSFLASVVSMILSVIAIWLAFKFYKMSLESSERIEEANRAIEASVRKLEQIFQMQYSDTFSMLRDTYSDFRKSLLASNAMSPERSDLMVERKANEKVEDLKAEMKSELSNVVESVTGTSPSLDSVRDSLEKVVDKAIAKSRRVDSEAREETLKGLIDNYLKNAPHTTGEWRVGGIFNELKDKFTLAEIARALFALQREGTIKFSTPFENWYDIAHDSRIVEAKIS